MILTHLTKLSSLHQLGSCLFFLLSLLRMGEGSERSFVLFWMLELFCQIFPSTGWESFCSLSSVHTVFQGKGTVPEDNISLTGGLWVPGIRNILCEEAAYEERRYPAGKWACVTKGEPMYEQSISMSFMKLMRYICKENSVGCYLGMTVPVLNEIHLTKDETELEREVVTAYYLPGEFQQNPPVPMDPEIHITERAPLRVITR
ncbi:heme-binding protein 1-like isoform X3 [Pipra filicauda]|nr:heme-binding protein 1-like isoform X3 [Pipra filicauda]